MKEHQPLDSIGACRLAVRAALRATSGKPIRFQGPILEIAPRLASYWSTRLPSSSKIKP
jgi:hypothetical protein